MTEYTEDHGEDASPTSGNSDIFDELLQAELELQNVGERLHAEERRIETDRLLDVVRHGPVLEALRERPLDRREIEDRLNISRATSHRFVRWLDEHGYVEKADGRLRLTGTGQGVADEVLRFERNVSAFERLAPLCDAICDDHQEFVVEPFADASVTTATPDDPYRPVRRFVSLLAESATFYGFNTGHLLALGVEEFADSLFETTDAELISLPSVVDTLFEEFPERAGALLDGHLALRTREAFPYGLAIFDDRVGIGGYDEETGTMTVFVDSDAAIAQEWAVRVYETYRSDSDPLDERVSASRYSSPASE